MANTHLVTWDGSGEKIYEAGVDHCVLYPSTSSGYKPGVAWNGITSITESPDGAEPNDLYADNIKYASLRSAETFGGTIEAYTYPKEFEKCNGEASPTGVAGLVIGQQERAKFGLCYRTKIGNDTSGDSYGYRLHLVYGCTASPSERAYETINDSPDAITFSWEFDTVPVDVTGFKQTSTLVVDSTKFTGDDADKLALLEDKLYGVAGATSAQDVDAELPDPDTVIGILNGTITT